jgi:hypothetical protein
VFAIRHRRASAGRPSGCASIGPSVCPHASHFSGRRRSPAAYSPLSQRSARMRSLDVKPLYWFTRACQVAPAIYIKEAVSQCV